MYRLTTYSLTTMAVSTVKNDETDEIIQKPDVLNSNISTMFDKN